MKNNTYQDKSYYKNLKELNLNNIVKKLKQDKKQLENKYKIKSMYIYGSFSKNAQRIDSDIDIALRLSFDLTKQEKKEILQELGKYFYKNFRRYIDVHELLDTIDENFIKNTENIMKIY